MWSLWLSPSDGVAAQCRVACEPQTGRAHLAPRGAEGAAKAAEARSALAERRIMHPASARVSGPCLVLRLRPRPHPLWSQIPDPVDHRRSEPGMHGPDGGEEAQERPRAGSVKSGVAGKGMAE